MYQKAVYLFIKKKLQNIGRSDSNQTKGFWRSSLGAISGATLLAFLTRLLCPACWPAYAGLLSSMGLGFLLKTAWLLPLTTVTLVFVIGALAFRANRRRGYGPFMLGLLGSSALLAGQFVFTSGVVMSEWGIDGGALLLIVASLWNGWPCKRKGMETGECPSCPSEILGT